MKKGIFWIPFDDELRMNDAYLFFIECDQTGEPNSPLTGSGIAKSGMNYNHKKMWESLDRELTFGEPFDYFPRGRVEIANGIAKVYLHPTLNTARVKEYLIDRYGLSNPLIRKVVFLSDGSAHYRCRRDEEDALLLDWAKEALEQVKRGEVSTYKNAEEMWEELLQSKKKSMKIYLLERNESKATALKAAFKDEFVDVVCDDFLSFMKMYDVECVVSPANAYGLMDGGYDAAISEWFGDQLQERVQKYIIEHYYGEQPVGTSFIIDAGKNGQKLIHTPTMRVPSKILDPAVVYQAMRTTLMVALENNVKSIVIPIFGGLTGEVEAETAAKLMWLGYDSIIRPNKTINWDVAWGNDDKWIELGLKE